MKFCPECGQAVELESGNKYVCSNGHEHWADATPASMVYIVDGDKVLYGVRSLGPNAGGLNVVGGFVDPDENFEEAAVREAREEMGIEVELIDYLGSYPSKYYGGKTVLNTVFIAKMTGGKITPADDMNGGDPVWRDINDLPTEPELAWPWQTTAQADLQHWHKGVQ